MPSPLKGPLCAHGATLVARPASVICSSCGATGGYSPLWEYRNAYTKPLVRVTPSKNRSELSIGLASELTLAISSGAAAPSSSHPSEPPTSALEGASASLKATRPPLALMSSIAAPTGVGTVSACAGPKRWPGPDADAHAITPLAADTALGNAGLARRAATARPSARAAVAAGRPATAASGAPASVARARIDILRGPPARPIGGG
jgi:hypothetical protein